MMDEQEQYPQGYDKQAQDLSVNDYTTESALRIRLDTSMLKMQIKQFLEGKQESIQRNKQGNLLVKLESTGKAMANEIGIQRIMSYIEHFVNAHTFQGNIKEDKHEIMMERTRVELACILAVNMYDYGIDEEELELITDNVCNLIENTSTRPINNEERKSFVGTVIHSESSQANYAKQKSEGLWAKLKIGK
jgi:hypothetical protein